MIYYLTKNIYLTNYGDIAIDYASLKLLNDNCFNYIIITPENYKNFKIDKNDILLVRGGGYFGLYNEIDFKKILNEVHCKKVLMPSSLYFNNKDNNNIDEIKDLPLIIFARDKVSYDNYKKNFKKSLIKMCPDIVLSLNKEYIKKTKKIGLMARQTEIDVDISSLPFEKFNHSNKELKWDKITFEKLKCSYEKFLNVIGKYEKIITNSLHMVILSYLTNTQCLAFDNKCGKVFNTIDSYLPNIVKCKNLEDVYKSHVFSTEVYSFKEFDELVYFLKFLNEIKF